MSIQLALPFDEGPIGRAYSPFTSDDSWWLELSVSQYADLSADPSSSQTIFRESSYRVWSNDRIRTLLKSWFTENGYFNE